LLTIVVANARVQVNLSVDHLAVAVVETGAEYMVILDSDILG
jgi:hypothetical protein